MTRCRTVRKLIKKLGIELLDDPVIGRYFIQPLKSQASSKCRTRDDIRVKL